jgi:hypothetical protein
MGPTLFSRVADGITAHRSTDRIRITNPSEAQTSTQRRPPW